MTTGFSGFDKKWKLFFVGIDPGKEEDWLLLF